MLVNAFAFFKCITKMLSLQARQKIVSLKGGSVTVTTTLNGVTHCESL